MRGISNHSAITFDQELSGGQVWWDKILEKVRGFDILVFVLDQAALQSTACKREYGYAKDLGKPILPVLVEEGVPTNLLPPALSQIQYVDYRKQDRKTAFSLARALATIPTSVLLHDPLPAAPEAPISYLGNLTERLETADVLSYEEQSSMLIDLKRSMYEPSTTEDARTLLGRLRKRRDLYAAIGDEIDELLHVTHETATPSPHATKPKWASAGRTKAAQTSTTGDKKASSAEHQEIPGSTSPFKPAVSCRKPTTDERKQGARKLSIVFTVVGLLQLVSVFIINGYSVNYLFFILLGSVVPLTLSGAIAGAISGLENRGHVAAYTGMAIMVLIGSAGYTGGLIISLFILLAPPLFSFVAMRFLTAKTQSA